MQEQFSLVQRIEKYAPWLHARTMEQLTWAGQNMSGYKIYEINSTATGGGVVELLRSQIPLMLGLGIDVHWLVLPPDKRFFTITKQLHNALQGGRDRLPEDLEYYDHYTQAVAASLPRDGDLYILHDPQTLGLIPFLADKPVIWRCHIDLTNAEPQTYAWLRRRLREVRRSIFSMESYSAGMPRSAIVAPSIDPLQPKNQPLAATQADSLLARLGIDPSRPFVTQVSRYDQFKDPLGVLQVFSRAQPQVAGLQCVLLGNYATDDPEGQQIYESVMRAADSLADTHVLVNVPNNELVVNALQSRAAGVLQYSSREGFGLTVTEAMWKRSLVFVRPVGGILLQVRDHATGIYLTGKSEADAERLVRGIRSPELRDRLGAAAHDYVAEHFITPVMLNQYLQVYQQVLSATMTTV